VGCLLNQVVEPEEQGAIASDRLWFEPTLPGVNFAKLVEPFKQAFESVGLNLVGAVPYRKELSSLRISDVAQSLGATIVHAGDQERRVLSVTLAAKAVPAVLHAFRPGTLVIVPGDRSEVLMAAARAG
jgi:phosphate acetyltransferase